MPWGMDNWLPERQPWEGGDVPAMGGAAPAPPDPQDEYETILMQHLRNLAREPEPEMVRPRPDTFGDRFAQNIADMDLHAPNTFLGQLLAGGAQGFAANRVRQINADPGSLANRVRAQQQARISPLERYRLLGDALKEQREYKKDRDSRAPKPAKIDPVRLGEGDVLVDPATGRRIAAGPPKPTKSVSGQPTVVQNEDGSTTIIPAGGKFPSAGERESLAKDSAVLKELADLRGRFKPEFVGPRSAIRTAAARFSDRALMQGEADFRASLAAFRNRVINEISGAAVSESEAKRMEQELPNLMDPPKTFRAKMDQTERNRRTLANSRRSTMSRTGVNLSGLEALPGDGLEDDDGIRVRR